MDKGELAHLVGSVANNRDRCTIRFGVDLWVKDILDLHRFDSNRANCRYRVSADCVFQSGPEDGPCAEGLLSVTNDVPSQRVQISEVGRWCIHTESS